MTEPVSKPSEQIADESLARLAQTGDWSSFETLVRRYEARVYGFCRQCCRHETDARELTQETFVSAFQHLAKFNPSLSFATWLFVIARRKCIDRQRRPWRGHDGEIPEPSHEDDPAAVLGRRDAAENLWRLARRVVTETQFQTLWLHYAEDLSIREVAQVMRRTQPHVKVLLFRARQKLAAALKKSEMGGRPDSDPARLGFTSPSRCV